MTPTSLSDSLAKKIHNVAFYEMLVSIDGSTIQIISVDDDIESILHLSAASVLEDINNFYQLVVPEDMAEVYKMERHAFENGSPFTVQLRCHVLDSDQVKTIQLFTSKHHTDDKGFQYWKGLILDVTESVQRQEDLFSQLVEEQALFKNTFEQAAIGLAHVSLKGQFTKVNKRFADFLGYSQKEILSKTFGELTALADREKSAEAVKKLLSPDAADQVQLRKRYISAAGNTLWGNVMISLIRDDAGNPDYFITALEDISENILLENVLLEQQQEIRDLIDHADIWLSSFDQDVRYLHVNQKYSDTFGLPVADIEGSLASEILPEAIYQQHEPMIKRCFEGERVEFDTELVTPAGVQYTAGVYTPIRGDGEVIKRAVVAVTDVTEKVTLTKSLQRSDDIFSALNHHLPKLFKSELSQALLDELIVSLGKAANVSRAYLFTVKATASDFLATQTNEWVNVGIKSQWEYDDNEQIPMKEMGLEGIVSLFLNDQVLNSTVSDLPESERPFLELQEIKTLVAVPIYVSGEWWGFLGFDDCETEQVWSETEVNTLVVCAKSIGSAIEYQSLQNEKTALEKEAKLSEERIRESLEAAEHGVWEWDMLTNQVYYSPIWKRMLGFEENEIGKDLSEFESRVHPDEKAMVWGLIDEHMQHNTSGFKAEFRMLSKSGDWVWILAHGRLLKRDDDGNPLRLVGTHTDITAFKQTELALKKSEENFRQLFEANKAVELIIYPATGQIINANRAAQDFYGYSEADLLDMNIADINMLTPAEIKQEMAAAAIEKRNRFNFKHKLASGEIRDVEVLSGPVFYNDMQCLYSIVLDVTEQKKAQKNLLLSRNVFENAHDGIVVCDSNVHIIDVNPTFVEITGYKKEEVIGKNPRFLASGKQSKSFYEKMWQAINKKGFWSGELWNQNKAGDLYAIQSNISTIKNEQGIITNYISAFTDITDLKTQQEQLETLAHFDPLTQLPNRTLLADRLNQAIAHANRSSSSLGICFLDLDNFKLFNDSYGHNAGDSLLVDVANTLKALLREEDTVARLGGDEFIILIGDIHHKDDLSTMANKILQVVTNVASQSKYPNSLSGSLGMTLYPEDTSDPDTLIRHSDQAMYQAKVRGRNRYHLFDMDADEASVQRHQSISNIREALNQNDLELFYQPKADIQTGELAGFEGLIRWNHSEKGIIFPDDFLPVIEGHELEVELDNWVLEMAIQQLKTWHHKGYSYPISINICGNSLLSNHFVDGLTKLLETHTELAPDLLQIEVLESSTLNDIAIVNQNLKAIRNLGVQIALDDFGTGYSSLSYLKSLPADVLKIDRSFIADILVDKSDEAIVKGIIQLADVFELDVIAEGVENQQIAERLKAFGCRLVQGYWLAKPQPISKIESLIVSWNAEDIKID